MGDQGSAVRWQATYLLTVRQRVLYSLITCIGMAMLSSGNFLLHAHFPNLVAWLPAGAALGLTLLLGPSLLPAIVLGSAAGLIASGAESHFAILSTAISGLACLLAWALLCVFRPIDFGQQAVSTVARLLLTSCLLFAVGAYLAGPAAISHLIHHDGRPGSHQAESGDHHSMQQFSAAPASHGVDGVHGGHQSHADSSLQHGDHHDDSKGRLEMLLIDAIGVLLVVPLIAWLAQRRSAQLGDLKENLQGAFCTLLLLMATALAIYSGYLERSFGMVHTTLLVLPPAVWLALEYGVGYTLLGNFLIFFITGIGTSLGYGPFKDHSAGLPLMTVVILTTTLLIAASRSERKQAESTIQHMATHDVLTGVTNRIAFTQRVEQALRTAQRHGHSIAILFIDLNRFKQVNDTLGHQAGDLLLVEIAERLTSCIRSDSMLARFGGDEFVILIDHVEDRESLAGIAQRIASAVSLPCSILNQDCQVGCSVGISVYPDDGMTVTELMKKADAAMYRIKNQRHVSGGFMFYSVDNTADCSGRLLPQA